MPPAFSITASKQAACVWHTAVPAKWKVPPNTTAATLGFTGGCSPEGCRGRSPVSAWAAVAVPSPRMRSTEKGCSNMRSVEQMGCCCVSSQRGAVRSCALLWPQQGTGVTARHSHNCCRQRSHHPLLTPYVCCLYFECCCCVKRPCRFCPLCTTLDCLQFHTGTTSSCVDHPCGPNN